MEKTQVLTEIQEAFKNQKMQKPKKNVFEASRGENQRLLGDVQ